MPGRAGGSCQPLDGDTLLVRGVVGDAGDREMATEGAPFGLDILPGKPRVEPCCAVRQPFELARQARPDDARTALAEQTPALELQGDRSRLRGCLPQRRDRLDPGEWGRAEELEREMEPVAMDPAQFGKVRPLAT